MNTSQPSVAARLQPGQFSIRSLGTIGEGGLGIVDAVQVVASNRAHPVGALLARKRLNNRWVLDCGARERFEREIVMLSTMSHPNIVSLQGVSLPGGERWYVMPLFSGSLRSELTAGFRRDPSAVASIGIAIADALSYAHQLGFTHRDIKPENILLAATGVPVISDWGLGQFIHRHSRVLNLTLGGPMGSEYYCSLEQWATGDGGVAGDVYSLGMVLGELAAGRAIPIGGTGWGIDEDVVPAVTLANLAFNEAIRRMTKMLKSDRYTDMRQVVTALRLALG